MNYKEKKIMRENLERFLNKAWCKDSAYIAEKIITDLAPKIPEEPRKNIVDKWHYIAMGHYHEKRLKELKSYVYTYINNYL